MLNQCVLKLCPKHSGGTRNASISSITLQLIRSDYLLVWSIHGICICVNTTPRRKDI